MWAQGLEVEKPLTLTTRQEAKTYERLDLNQVPCALLILHLNDDNVDFEGDIRTMQYRNNGEWWLWMIQGSNWLTVKSPKWSPLRLDFESMQSSKTYEMTLRPVMTLKLAITEPLRADISMQDASSTKWGRKDANGRTCALLRIGLVLPEAKFVGKWVVDSEYHDGEWYVWLSPDATQLTVTAEGYQALALEFDPVKASTTYVMTLLKEGSQRYKWEEVPEGFVDLGLSSSTLWAEDNWSDSDGEIYHFEWPYVMEQGYGQLMPTRTMVKELMTECKWTWVGKGYKVVGPNGNSILLPADGGYFPDTIVRIVHGKLNEWKGYPEDFGEVGYYWTSMPAGVDDVWVWGFKSDTVGMDVSDSYWGHSVRLVLTPEIVQEYGKIKFPKTEKSYAKAKHIYPSMMATSSDGKDYIDLGLPSGTRWKCVEEGGLFTYEDAVSRFGKNLPNKKAFDELRTKCTWKWEDEGYRVTGPNGQSIFMPAQGAIDGGTPVAVGERGCYWSTTVKPADYYTPEDRMYVLVFSPDSSWMQPFYYKRTSLSVWLVEPAGGDDDVIELVISDDEEENVVDLGVIDDDADYVDLGLPSGTKWKSSNQSGYYDYDGAVKAFGNSMPTVEQWHELKTKCRWEWQNNNAKVTGPNGKSIILSAEGYYDYEDGRASSSSSGYYWSRTPSHHGMSVYLRFNSYDEKVDMNEYNRGRGHSIRLVKSSDKDQKSAPKSSTTVETKGNSNVATDVAGNGAQYVDLGLPSGTQWKSDNESGYYDYNAAMSKYGNSLPTKEQLEELKDKCTWTWTGKAYRVTGPNGNSIVLPADGTQNCYGENNGKKGVWGGYWSCSAVGANNACYLGILDPKAAGKYLSPYKVSNDKHCFGYSVRLVQSQAKEEDDEIHLFVSVPPEFPEGDEGLREFLSLYLAYPQQARDNNITGTVYVSFVVERDGSVSNVSLLRDIGGGCGEAAVRAVQAMPLWKPGMSGGKPVRVQKMLSIPFPY